MRLAILAAALTAWPARAAWAQGGPPPGSAEAAPTEEYIEYQKKSGEEGPDPELEVQHYDRQLNFTAEQKKKVRAIFEGQRSVFRRSHELRSQFQKETDELHRKIQELNRKFDLESRKIEEAHGKAQDRLRALLTPRQQQAFDVMTAERAKAEKEWRERKVQEDLRRHGGDGVQGRWGGGGPPPGKP